METTKSLNSQLSTTHQTGQYIFLTLRIQQLLLEATRRLLLTLIFYASCLKKLVSSRSIPKRLFDVVQACKILLDLSKPVFHKLNDICTYGVLDSRSHSEAVESSYRLDLLVPVSVSRQNA